VLLKNLDTIQIIGFALSAIVSIVLLIARQDTVASITLGFVLAILIQLFDLQKRHADSQEQVLQRIGASAPFQVLIGQERIFNELIRLVNECDDDDLIKATGLTPEPKAITEYAHPEWFETVARRIKKAKGNDRSLAYRVVLGKESPDRRRKSIEERYQAFSAAGVLDRLSIRSVNMTWPMEMLIVGNSVFLGFVSSARDLPFRAGIMVTHKELAGIISDWYNDFLWSIGQDEILSTS
jgi:hypothetical protein